MTRNHGINQLVLIGSTVKRWLATGLFSIAMMALVWQGALLSDALAAPNLLTNPASNLVLATDVGNQVQQKANEDAGRAKGFVRDTADKVERTARKNAARVEDATDSDGSYVERKAKRDAGRIEQRAEEDASRTQKAVDNTKNAVERAVDGIKDAFGG